MICERCGFEYAGENCPACAVREAREAQEALPKRSTLGVVGMILSLCSFAGTVLAIFRALFGIPVGIFDFPLAFAGLILSIIGKAKCKYDGFATAGIIISIIRIVMKIATAILAVLLLVLVFLLVFIAEGSATVY